MLSHNPTNSVNLVVALLLSKHRSC